MGVHFTTAIFDKYNKVKRSNTFELDHYPSKQEIIDEVINYYDKSEFRNMEVLSYSELTKEQYEAYNK